jgi:hypothetical protein
MNENEQTLHQRFLAVIRPVKADVLVVESATMTQDQLYEISN